MTSRRGRWIAVVLLAGIGCSEPTGYRASFARSASEIPASEKNADFLKVHTKDGRLFVLTRWSVDGAAATGVGLQYDVARSVVSKGPQSVPVGDVAIFETTRPETIPRSPVGYVVLGFVTVGSLALTAYCAVNPKACFGSCPTFYVHDAGEGAWKLQAEGFSASIAKPLEETDVDAMWTARSTPGSSQLDVQMANEALETHLVDHVRVLAVPRPPGMRVYRAGSSEGAKSAYFAAPLPAGPSSCRAGERDCLAEVRAIDERAYLSAADPEDLASTETIELELESPSRTRNEKRLGLVFAARNSLLNTFVFYQGLGYGGGQVGDLYARLETESVEKTAHIARSFRDLIHVLGGIKAEVLVKDGSWRSIGEYFEVGPIAREVEVLPFPADVDLSDRGSGPIRVRLTLGKGSWKLDHVGLVALGENVEPRALEPAQVFKAGKPDADALARLAPGGERLITYPGDLYTLRFELPEGDSELFLESRGYYYEWMREHWLKDESPIDAARMLANPRGAMRSLAPRYKRVEGEMERIFWNSRVGVKHDGGRP